VGAMLEDVAAAWLVLAPVVGLVIALVLALVWLSGGRHPALSDSVEAEQEDRPHP
jgi:hypothetical protein